MPWPTRKLPPANSGIGFRILYVGNDLKPTLQNSLPTISSTWTRLAWYRSKVSRASLPSGDNNIRAGADSGADSS
jgi:hypothetical protein